MHINRTINFVEVLLKVLRLMPDFRPLLPRLYYFIITCRAEKENGGLSQVGVHIVGNGHLCMSKGRKLFSIGQKHLIANVIKQDSKGLAAQRCHLEGGKMVSGNNLHNTGKFTLVTTQGS